jgi:2-oxo-4-hydroxy-4-carboxy-5-ureidoimidazoline decarboxylase
VIELHAVLNDLSEAGAKQLLHTCCASERWVAAMVAARPFQSTDSVYSIASEQWRCMERPDLLQAFEGHPQIGGDLALLRAKYKFSPSAVAWSLQEQSDVALAAEDVLRRLRDGNAAYLQRFGHIFIVFATGKSAGEMLALLEERLPNAPEVELQIAAAEQEKILLSRLRKVTS